MHVLNKYGGAEKETNKYRMRHDMCHFYDVIRVDAEERSNEQHEEISLEDQRILSSYLPLLREFIPSAALEIESDLSAQSSKQESEGEYVYDLYAVKEEMDIVNEDSSNPFPLVQVDDNDFYDGPDDSGYDSDDSQAEKNPYFDYPEEESEEEEEESESEASENESEENESSSDKSSVAKDLEDNDLLEDDIYGHDHDGDDFYYDVDGIESDDEDPKMVL